MGLSRRLLLAAVSAIPFGVWTGVLAGQQRGLTQGIIVGVGSGLVFGFVFQHFVVAFARRTERDPDRIGGRPDLGRGEIVARDVAAVCEQEGTARGGRLAVTNRGIHFSPYRLDTGLESRRLFIPLPDVERVYVAPRQFGLRHLLSGGLFRRLAIEARGERYYFLVEKVRRMLACIESKRRERLEEMGLEVAPSTEPRTESTPS